MQNVLGRLGLFLTLILAACAPSTRPSASANLPPYEGPIETMTIVLSSGGYFSSLEAVVYDEIVTSFFENPYARSRFDLVERQDTNALLNEQLLIRDGFVDNEAGPRIGKLIGAQYVLIVEVTNASATSVSGGGLSIGGMRLGGSGYNTDLRVSLRLVDSETGILVGRSTGRASQLVADGLSLDSLNAQLSDTDSALLSVLPVALAEAVDAILLQIL